MMLAPLALLIAQATLQPPQTPQAAPQPGTATIRGHVFAADTGEPLRKAQVRIAANEIRENRLVTTDANGAYEFTDVRPGRYTITASKGSYVGLAYGQTRATDAPKPLEILARQTVDRLDLSLPRGGVITGRIVDDYGEPMSDVQVSPQRYQFIQGQRTLVPSGRMSLTNDLGEFRLFGIAPGQYYLQATWRRMNVDANGSPADRLTFAPTFFPGTTNPAEAQRMTIAAGQEISDLVMMLRPAKAARVSGTVTGADGKPMTPAMVMAMRTTGMGADVAGNGQVRADGTFAINALAPGEYSLRAQRAGLAGEGPEIANATIIVNGEDVSDVHLVAAAPSSASGRLVVDPAAASQLPRTIALELFPATMNFMIAGPPPPPVNVSDDFTFTMKSPPGKMRVQLGGFGPPPVGWTVKSVRINGVDVSDSGIEFKPGEDITGVEIELTNKLTTVSGVVTSGGNAVKEYTVVVFAQDKEKWSGAARYQGIGRPDQDGRFKTGNLPAGDYYIVALDRVEPGQWTDPEFLESIRSRASTLSLMDGETKVVDLKLTRQP
jgi:protocatechuate 3,4-dioxygenase beta subunit